MPNQSKSSSAVPSKRTFYKTVFSVEVLSERPVRPDLSLAEIAELISNGDYRERRLPDTITELTGPEAAHALVAQGRVPWVFGLTASGADVE